MSIWLLHALFVCVSACVRACVQSDGCGGYYPLHQRGGRGWHSSTAATLQQRGADVIINHCIVSITYSRPVSPTQTVQLTLSSTITSYQLGRPIFTTVLCLHCIQQRGDIIISIAYCTCLYQVLSCIVLHGKVKFHINTESYISIYTVYRTWEGWRIYRMYVYSGFCHGQVEPRWTLSVWGKCENECFR